MSRPEVAGPPVSTGRPIKPEAAPVPFLNEEPVVADTIIFATDPMEAKRMADDLGVKFEDVQWYRSAAMLGDVDISDRDVKYTPAFTHRADYAATRERAKLKTGKGRRRETAVRTAE